MHHDNKLTNHGKQVNSAAPALLSNVSPQPQGPHGSLGSKAIVAGGHGAKANQISPGNPALKGSGQLGGAVGATPKGKAKRERSTSVDTGEQRDTMDADAKEGAMRSKRRCVLVKKQPYSGDEWCSGPDTEDEEDKPPATTLRELSGPVQSLTVSTPMGPHGESGCSGMGRGIEISRPSQQVVYVFTTNLANNAAEAVLHGHAESILTFHQQNVPRTKLDKLNSGGTPPTSTPKSQSGTPRPASALPTSIATPTRNCEDDPGQPRPPEGPVQLPHPGSAGTPSPGPAGGQASLLHGNSGDGLSKEQLEHRERSLQTLRDIERLFLRDPHGNVGANGNGEGSEGPLQSIISQTQSLEDGAMPPLHHQHPHHHPHMSPDMGPLLGPEGLTPEQRAWRKLQEEYYQEKQQQQRRQQEMQQPHPHHYRMLSEMGMGSPVVRGPPPPYHSKPGDPQWSGIVAGGTGRLLGQRGSGGYNPIEAMGHQRPPRPGMAWLEDMQPNIGPGGSPFPGCYPPERLLSREDMIRVLEKRHRQQQQQQQGGGPFMGPGPRGDPIDFPGSRTIMGGGRGGGAIQPLRDLLESDVNPQMQEMMLVQKLRAGPGPGGVEMLSPEELSRLRVAQNGRGGQGNKPPQALQFPSQPPFPGGYLPPEPSLEMFVPEHPHPPQMDGSSRLSHMPHAGPLGARHPSDVPPAGSTAVPPPPPSHQLKSPSLSQEASPLMPSPSAPGLKSPAGPVPAPTVTPSSSMKSPQVLGPSSLSLRSPSGSPGRLKSPAMPVSSPVWAASPKTALPSPGGATGVKGVGNGGSSSTETGPSLPPRSTNSTPISQPGSMNPSMPFTSSPDGPPSQNPLSLIMSQMSKYAMPSSTPLYHDAIKTIATSDDEMLPDRPLLPVVNMTGNMGNHQSSQMLLGPHSGPQSPMGMVLQGQPLLSHDHSGPMLHSPSALGMMGGAPEGLDPCSVSPMLPQGVLGGFSRLQPSPPQYAPPPEDVLHHPHHLRLPHQQRPPPPDSFHGSPDLSDVIRPTPTGIPEFDLSRIIPADKPSSTLQYFPKGGEDMGPVAPNPQQALKQQQQPPPPPSSNPHLANLQNMMVEEQLRLPRGMGPSCHPMGRPTTMAPPLPQQQHHHHPQMGGGLLHHHHHPAHMMSPPTHQQSLMAQQNMSMMMIQAKQRAMSVSGDPYAQQGLLMSPQGPMMGPPHPQSGMMGPQALRQRGMSLDSPLGYGHSGMANMPF